MNTTELWAVQYLRAARLEGGVVHHPEQPRIYRIVAFSGDTVWGINHRTGVLTKVNRAAADGSGRIMTMLAFDNLSDAESAAEQITTEIDAEETRITLEQAAEETAKRAAQQAMYPAVQPPDGDTPPPAQITSTFTIRTTREKNTDAPEE